MPIYRRRTVPAELASYDGDSIHRCANFRACNDNPAIRLKLDGGEIVGKGFSTADLLDRPIGLEQ